MFKSKLLIALGALLMFWAIGCSDNPTQVEESDQVDLSDEFGGYSTASEQPGFGDAELLEAAGAEEEVTDPILASAPVQQMVNDSQAMMFHLRAVWGQLRLDSTVTDQTDWAGSLSVNRGAIVVRRLIRFEPATDNLLPRTSRQLVEWNSITTIHHDGIAIDLYVPPQGPAYDTTFVDDSTIVVDTIPAEEVILSFATGPYSRDFTLRELAALDTVVELDDGNSVAFQGFQWVRNVCARGALAGYWGYDNEGNGVFKGVWHSRQGHIAGYVMGNFGQDDATRNVFYGKWIDLSGEFEGLLRGSWGVRPNVRASDMANHRGNGWFAGGIYNSNTDLIGWLRGNWHASPRVAGGWFNGRWKVACDVPINIDDGGETDDGIDNPASLAGF